LKLGKDAGEDDYLFVLGLLNSSLFCFWGRQVFFSKRGEDVGKWGEFLELDGTKLKMFPVVKDLRGEVLCFSKEIERRASFLSDVDPAKVVRNSKDVDADLADAWCKELDLQRKMIAAQEE